MAEFKFSCPKCDQHIQCDDAHSGVQINCPSCQETLVVPQAPWASAPPPVRPPSAPPGIAMQRPAASAPRAPVPLPGSTRAAYKPVAPSGSRVGRTILIISAIVVACAVLGGGGWYFYKQHKAKVAAQGNPAAHVPKPSQQAASAAEEILEKMGQAYQGLTSFSATETSVSVIDLSGLTPADIPGANNNRRPPQLPKTPQTTTAELSIKLAKPDLYRIEWKTKAGRGTVAGAVWSSGDGDFTLMNRRHTKAANRKAALGFSQGSGGLSAGVAHLFFGEMEELAKDTKNWGKGSDELLNGEDCHVLTGTVNGQKLQIWVSKTSFLVLQSQVTLGGKVNESDIAEGMKAMGGNPNATPQQQAQMKEQMQQAMAMATKLRGSVTETFSNIETNQTFTAEDFKYPVPSDIKLSP